MIDDLKKFCKERGIQLIDKESILPEGWGILYSHKYKMIILSKGVLDIDISACIDHLNGMTIESGVLV